MSAPPAPTATAAGRPRRSRLALVAALPWIGLGLLIAGVAIVAGAIAVILVAGRPRAPAPT
jgi:hypothetical protein